jgi:hypothetical protein
VIFRLTAKPKLIDKRNSEKYIFFCLIPNRARPIKNIINGSLLFQNVQLEYCRKTISIYAIKYKLVFESLRLQIARYKIIKENILPRTPTSLLASIESPKMR